MNNQDLILPFQIIEFDLKVPPLDSSSFIDVVVKDYETIGKDSMLITSVLLYGPLWILTSHKMASMVKENHISLCFLLRWCGWYSAFAEWVWWVFSCKTTSHNHFTLYVNMTEVEITAV